MKKKSFFRILFLSLVAMAVGLLLLNTLLPSPVWAWGSTTSSPLGRDFATHQFIYREAYNCLQALASGAKGQVLLASRDNAVDLQQAMFRAVNIATGQAQSSGGGGGLVSSADSGQSSLLVILLVAVILLLLVSIILLRRNRSTPPGADADHAVRASLEIYSAGGGLKIVAIASSRTAIGRAPDNQLVIADSSVSQHHAEIVANERGFLIRDLGSANGTRVNGKKIGECSLYLGDEIALGSIRMKLGR